MKMSILFILLAPPFTRPSPNGPSPSSPSSQQCNSSAKDTTGTILSRSSVERGFHFTFSFVPLHLLTPSCDPVNPNPLFPYPHRAPLFTRSSVVSVSSGNKSSGGICTWNYYAERSRSSKTVPVVRLPCKRKETKPYNEPDVAQKQQNGPSNS